MNRFPRCHKSSNSRNPPSDAESEPVSASVYGYKGCSSIDFVLGVALGTSKKFCYSGMSLQALCASSGGKFMEAVAGQETMTARDEGRLTGNTIRVTARLVLLSTGMTRNVLFINLDAVWTIYSDESRTLVSTTQARNSSKRFASSRVRIGASTKSKK